MRSQYVCWWSGALFFCQSAVIVFCVFLFLYTLFGECTIWNLRARFLFSVCGIQFTKVRRKEQEKLTNKNKPNQKQNRMNQIPLLWIYSLVWCFFFYFGTLTLDVKYKFLICSPVDPCSPAVLHDPESPRRRSRGRVETSSEPPNKVVVISMTSGPLKPQPPASRSTSRWLVAPPTPTRVVLPSSNQFALLVLRQWAVLVLLLYGPPVPLFTFA